MFPCCTHREPLTIFYVNHISSNQNVPRGQKICIYSDSSDPLPLKHGGLGQRPKCLITTFTLKSVRLAAQDSILHTKQLFNEKIKVTCCWFTCLSELLTEYVVFFICNLMSIMITSPDGTLSLAKVKFILVKPAVCTSHVCCILDKITGALMLPETGSLFGILRSYNWNSTLVVIDGVSGAHEYTLSNGYLDLWSRPLVGHMTLRPCLSEPRSLSWAASDPGSCVFDDGGKGFSHSNF